MYTVYGVVAWLIKWNNCPTSRREVQRRNISRRRVLVIYTVLLIALSRYATRTRTNELVRLTANDDRLLNKGRQADVASGIAVYGPLRMRLFDCRPNLIGVCNVKTTVRPGLVLVTSLRGPVVTDFTDRVRGLCSCDTVGIIGVSGPNKMYCRASLTSSRSVPPIYC